MFIRLMWITPVAYSLLELCVVFFKYWFQGSVSSEKPWGLAFEEAFPDPQRVTGGKVHELSELESFCRFKVRAHTKSRMPLYPMKGIKDVNLSREFYSRMHSHSGIEFLFQNGCRPALTIVRVL